MAKMADAGGPIIETLDDVAAGVRALTRSCAHMRQAHALAGDPPLQRDMAGFEGLARIVVGQQVSIASASAIWARVAAGVDPFTPEQMAGLDETALRGFGLSRPKIVTLSKLARHLVDAGDWLPELVAVPDDVVRERLTALPGIGPWTADVYLLFCLGRADGFAPGDLALQVAAQHLMDLEARPDAKALQAIAERWRPQRGVAARLLWAYYAAVKRRAGAPVTGTRVPDTQLTFEEQRMSTAAAFRRIALSLPGTTEAPHFKRQAFRVARIYATLDERCAYMMFTPDEQEFKVMLAPDAFAPLPNAWGRKGWTEVVLAKLSMEELEVALRMAYAHAQPRPKGTSKR